MVAQLDKSSIHLLGVVGPHTARRPPRAAAPGLRDDAYGRPNTARVVAMVGHELRGPLATALVFMRTVEAQLRAGVQREQLVSTLAVAREEVVRMQGLLGRVLELNRLGRAVLSPRLIDAGQVVRETVQRTLMSESGGRGSDVTVEVGGEAGAGDRRLVNYWDDLALEQIVRNLLSNALKFGEGRPVRVAAEPILGGGLRLLVQDRGLGVSGPVRAWLVGRARHPAEVGAASSGGGLGIGLWLVRELARAHAGAVAVHSQRGKGSTFTVVLAPLPPAVRAPVQSEQPIGRAAGALAAGAGPHRAPARSRTPTPVPVPVPVPRASLQPGLQELVVRSQT